MERLYKITCFIMIFVILISSFSMVFAVAYGEKKTYDLFGHDDIIQNIKNSELNMTSVIYAKNREGKWVEYQRLHGEENRIWTDIENVPQNLIDAFIAIEDQRYYQHGGVDWKRTFAAFINYLPFVEIYDSNHGGSTITQQLIKNITSDRDTSAVRKLREIGRALLIEKKLDKTTILEAYLNTISLGSGICGVQVAANYYFNKDVGELTLAECASIAAITKNPSAYNPETKPEGNKERRNDVLYMMYKLKRITKEEYQSACDSELQVDTSQKNNFELPVNNYFIDALISDVIDDLAAFYGCSTNTASTMLYNGGYRIYATIEPEVQAAMESVYSDRENYFKQTSYKDRSVGVQSAMTITDYEGNIKGIVGGVGEKTVNRGLNRAIDSPRQPGSTMKPLGVYTQAIENGSITYSSVLEDRPIDNYFGYGQPGPNEWYGYFAGNITVKYAVEHSANTIPCWILKDSVGVEESFAFLTQKLKLNNLTEIDKNISSLALGGCQYGVTTTESAAAYAIFGNGGRYYEPRTYLRVINSENEVILENENEGEQVIGSDTATIMNRLLQNVVYGADGTGGRIASYSNMKVYAKTGTSSESNDLWMVAGTPYYVGSVWYGFDQPLAVYNPSAAATVWRDIMKKVHEGLEKRDFNYSNDVYMGQYCTFTGNAPSTLCQSVGSGYYSKNKARTTCDGVHIEVVPYGTVVEEENVSSEEAVSSEAAESTPPQEDTPSDVLESSSQTATSEESKPEVTVSQEEKPKENEKKPAATVDKKEEDSKDNKKDNKKDKENSKAESSTVSSDKKEEKPKEDTKEESSKIDESSKKEESSEKETSDTSSEKKQVSE